MFTKTKSAVAALTMIVGAPALAQSAPEPYFATVIKVTVAASGTSCNVKSCLAEFPPVPVGKRLTINYASATYTLTQASGTTQVFVQNQDPARSIGILLPAPQTTGGLRYTATGPVTAFVSGGQKPAIFINGPYISRAANAVYVAITGYLSPM